MILADKIIDLRKKEGWSQEQLAEQMGVSRQSISKWESAQSTPDMNKILQLSKLFGVSTDFLLREDLESEPAPSSYIAAAGDDPSLNEKGEPLTAVSMEEANAYLAGKLKSSGQIALGVMFCILSPITLILMAAFAESGKIGLSENKACMLGLIPMFLLICGGVVLFVLNGLRLSKFEYLEKQSLDTAYGVDGMVKDLREKYESAHTRDMVIGIALCVIAAIPVFVTAILSEGWKNKVTVEFVQAIGVCGILLLVAIGVFLIVRTSIIWGSYQVLLEEGDYERENKKFENRYGVIYWCIVTAGYLLWSFITMDWDKTWLVWPVAGVLYGAFAMIMKPKK